MANAAASTPSSQWARQPAYTARGEDAGVVWSPGTPAILPVRCMSADSGTPLMDVTPTRPDREQGRIPALIYT